MMQTQICRRCGEDKPLIKFPKWGENRRRTCRTCRKLQWEENKIAEGVDFRAHRRKCHPKGYIFRRADSSFQDLKLSPKEIQKYAEELTSHYEKQREISENCCHICGEKEIKVDTLCRDHCHSTGQWRGVLCQKHNIALGLFNDDPELLEKAILYLDFWEERKCTVLKYTAPMRV